MCSLSSVHLFRLLWAPSARLAAPICSCLHPVRLPSNATVCLLDPARLHLPLLASVPLPSPPPCSAPSLPGIGCCWRMLASDSPLHRLLLLVPHALTGQPRACFSAWLPIACWHPAQWRAHRHAPEQCSNAQRICWFESCLFAFCSKGNR